MYGLSIGKDTTGRFKPSPLGIAVQSGDGKFVTYRDDKLVDVTGMTFEATDGHIYRIPVKSAKQGDLLLLSDSPLTAIFLEDDVEDDDSVSGINPLTCERVEYVQPISALGQRWFVKVFSSLNAVMSRPELMPLVFMKGSIDWTELVLLALSGAFGDMLPDRMLPDRDAIRKGKAKDAVK
jgi:hypothetical protein